MPLTEGSRLGPYEILTPLGAGGMGEVYKARDTRLDRIVAIKVLPAHVTGNVEARQRFEREARAVSSLNHPHICNLYDIGQQDGVDYLVLEHLDGETLQARLARGALPAQEAIPLAIQIADALGQAHRQGVVHRDLKPGNVMLTRSGAKLLDFGLAKVQAARDASRELTAAVTAAAPITSAGTVLGTFQYMSPEQLEGKDADSRADIFSFGAMFFEMLTGGKAFQGPSQASLITALMSHDPPPVSTLTPGTPPNLDRLIRKCLAKNPDDRWESARDLMVELKWIAEGGASTVAAALPVASRRRREVVAWALVALLTVAVVALGASRFRQEPVDALLTRFEVQAPPKVAFSGVDAVVISPDGRKLVFTGSLAGQRRMWLRNLSSLQTTLIAGSDGAFFPFWSPDSRFVAFYANEKLLKLDSNDGAIQTITKVTSSFGNTWDADVILMWGRDGIEQVSAGGGEPKLLVKPDKSRGEAALIWPSFLPDGRRFLYASVGSDPKKSGIYAASLDGMRPQRVADVVSNVSFVAPGLLLFGRGNSLMAQRLHPKSLQLDGEPVVIEDAVAQIGQRSSYSVSRNGTLVTRPPISTNQQLYWYERSGAKGQPVGAPQQYVQGALSPDEKRFAAQIGVNPNCDLWILDLASGVQSRFTNTEANEDTAAWSVDGREIVFSSNRTGRPTLYRKVVGGGEDQILFPSETPLYPSLFSKDGSLMFLNNGGRMFYRLRPGAGAKPESIFQTNYQKDGLRLSPDERWAVYSTLESGRWEVYAATFPDFAQRRQISSDGGVQGQWRSDGKEIFYLSLDGNMMSVPLRPGPAFEAGAPKMLFPTRIPVNPTWDQYSVARDGRFLIMDAVEGETKSFTVVLNWISAMKK